MINTLFRILIGLIIIGVLFWLGGVVIAAVHAPAIFGTLWLVVCVLCALYFLYRELSGGDGPRRPLI